MVGFFDPFAVVKWIGELHRLSFEVKRKPLLLDHCLAGNDVSIVDGIRAATTGIAMLVDKAGCVDIAFINISVRHDKQ